MNWDQHLVFNVFFVAISIAGILLETQILNHPYTIPEKEEPFVVFT